MLKRIVTLDLPEGQSVFVWGARKTGKSTYLKNFYPDAYWIDLLSHKEFARLNSYPHLLRDDILAQNIEGITTPIIIDEIQKIPALLDEIHWLIENNPVKRSFILCGSSLRRLKYDGSNLLGGRAWRQIFSPLCYPKLPSFDLKRILNQGLIPLHYLNEDYPKRALESYLNDYLIPEVQWESRMRQLGGFGRFLEAIAFSNGEIFNATHIARESGVSARTVQGYVDLLNDMLLGYLIFPFTTSESRQLIVSAPKFYFFDTAIVRALRLQSPLLEIRGAEAGHAFEHYVFLELFAYKSVSHASVDIKYWRTKTGLEVDFVLARGKVIIEAKITQPIERKDLKGLIAFAQEHHSERVIVVGLEPKKRIMIVQEIRIAIYPVEAFLKELWAGLIINPD